MFGKLLKYDFRSMWKQFAFIWPAALVLALVNRFTVPMMGSANEASELTAGIAMLIYVSIIAAMFIVAMIFVIQRFYKGLLGDEGYLMHTLPVRPWQLICSKLLCALSLTIVSILVAILSIFLIVPVSWNEFARGFHDLGRFLAQMIHDYHVNVPLVILEMLLFFLAGLALNYLHLYLSMAIGHLFNKNRIAISVIAYVAINALGSILASVAGYTIFRRLGDPIADILQRMGDWAAWHACMWTFILGIAAVAALFFFATEYILRKRLNLE